MKYDVAAVYDNGDNLSVQRVDTYQNSLMKGDGQYVRISNVAGDMIREALSEYKRVFLPKDVHGELCIKDVVIVDTDGLEKDRMIFLSDIYRKVDYHLYFASAIDFFDFMNASNELASLGYFITEKNREEKYLEIIESADEDLISMLEVYLENKDKLEKISYVYNKTRKFEKLVIDCKTPEELTQIKEDFNAS